MSWLMIGKFALVAFLVVGCSVLVIAYLRKRPRGGPKPLSDPNAAGYLDLYRGRVAPTPLPEWAERDEAAAGGDDGASGPGDDRG